MEKSLETEKRVDSECLLVVISGKTWYVPFDELEWIPRVGRRSKLRGEVTEKWQKLNMSSLLGQLPPEWEEK